MKNILIIVFLFPLFVINAQNEKGETTDKVYSYKEYIEKFENTINKTYAVKKKLAECYFNTGDFSLAEEYYKEVANSHESTSEDVYSYASVLSINKKYIEAELWMDKFANMEKCDSRAKRFSENKGYYLDLLNDDKKFKIKNLSSNTEFQDFGASFYNRKIVFASTRPSKSLLKRLFSFKRLSLQLFVADANRGEFENIKPFKKKFNKKLHEGPASFSNKGTVMAFTQDSYFTKEEDGIEQLQIFTSEKEGKKWGKPISVPFNYSKCSVAYPSLSKDGKTMYFASDIAGGYGGYDIYVVKRNENGEWGKPLNVGNKINTEGDEVFPFIHENGMLFFASNGLLGLGGLDIFYTKINNNKYLKPKNIGVPINSNFDDFTFIIDKKMKKGYFSSNRDGGKGNDDIYSFKLYEELTFDTEIKGKVLDKNNNALANVNVSLFDKDGNIIKTINSDNEGNYIFEVNPKDANRITASKPKYITAVIDIDNKEYKETIKQNFILEKLSDFSILCKVIDEKDNKTISDVRILTIDNKTGKKENFTTIENGEFLVQLNNYKLNDSVNFSFIIEKDGYASKSIDYENVLKWIGEYKFTVKMQKIEIGEDLGKILEINPIYFDFDKSEIRKDAAVELDKIVAIMNKYPKMVIELSSHTDCRGSAIYNLKLSDRRAKASAHYIKTRISNPTRIYGEGFGEKKLIVKCQACGGGSTAKKCTEADHQKNRRTEFKIIRK